MKKIPTAFEFWITRKGTEDGDIVEDLKEFARLHVEAALKSASEKATMQKEGFDYRERSTGIEQTGMVEYQGYEGYNEDPIVVSIEKDSILNAYPPENIK